MVNNRFRRGIHIQFAGRRYSIERRLLGGDLQIKDATTGECRNVPEMELVNALFNGHLEFYDDPKDCAGTQQRGVKTLVDDMAMLNDDDLRKKEAKRRYAYVQKIEASNLDSLTRANLEPLIEEVYETIKDSTKPYWKTVLYRWFFPYLASGKDVRVLVPSYKARGNRRRKFAGTRKCKGGKFYRKEKEKAIEVADIVNEVIDEEYLTPQRLSVQDVYDILDARISEINKFRDAGDQLPIPHKSSVYHAISKFDEYEKDTARYGKRYADHKHRCNKQGPRPTRPLERVELDHTTLDLFVVDQEARLPLGRPTVTAAVDKYSKSNLGIHVGFDHPGYVSVMQCLLHAIRPKTYIKTLYPCVKNDWEAYGIPELVVVDNGREFYSEDFDDACRQLGIATLYSPVKIPHYKASIERYFGTHNRRLLHKLPGTTFSNIMERKDYDPEKNAVISFEEFMKILHIWIVDIYHQSIHRGIKDIPARVWKEGIIKFPPALPQRQEDLRILLGHVEHRIIGPSGIELFNLFYNCGDLAPLRRGSKGKKFALKVNTADLSVIYVYDDRRDIYIPAPAVDQEYTNGLSLWQHRVITNYARKFVQQHVDIEALRRARKRIQEIVDQEWGERRRGGTRTRMARWNGIRQPDYDAALQTSGDEQVIEANKPLFAQNHQTSPLRGISNIGESALFKTVESDGGIVPSITDSQRPASTIEWPAKKENGNAHESHQLLREQTKSSEGISSLRKEDDLDMTGYNASFTLPIREV
jgi:putative transposase